MRKILVVDDDESILEALNIAMQLEGYNVLAVSKCEEVIPKALGYLPDLIILDILLLGGDGRKICQKLKITKETAHIPIIMISAHPGVKKTSKDFGADDFISKPFDFDNLFSKIQKHLK